MSRRVAAAGALVAALALAAFQAQAGSIVRFKTSLGKIDFVLLDDEAPSTALNFQGYALRGDYDSSIVHRSIRDFVIQGGGFGFDEGYFRVPTLDPIDTEKELSNLRGTVAIALGSLSNGNTDRDSGTSQWFVNLANNVGLDADFTVFARVPPADMAVVDAIADLTIESGQLATDDPLAAAFTNLPVLEPLERFVGECSEVLPEPAGSGAPNIIDNCGADDAARLRDLAARRAALSDSLPERLVMIEKAVVLPTARGSLRARLDAPIVVLEERAREEYVSGTGGPTTPRVFPQRTISRRQQLRDEEWGVDVGTTSWRATGVPAVSYSGDLEPRGTTGRRFGLTLDEATLADILANARVELEDQLFEETWALETFGPERLVRPEDQDGNPFTGGVLMEYPVDSYQFASAVIMVQNGEPKVRAVVNSAGDRITIRGRIPITGGTQMVVYHEVNGPGSPFRSDVATPIAGEVRFKIKGPFRRFKDDAPAP